MSGLCIRTWLVSGSRCCAAIVSAAVRRRSTLYTISASTARASTPPSLVERLYKEVARSNLSQGRSVSSPNLVDRLDNHFASHQRVGSRQHFVAEQLHQLQSVNALATNGKLLICAGQTTALAMVQSKRQGPGGVRQVIPDVVSQLTQQRRLHHHLICTALQGIKCDKCSSISMSYEAKAAVATCRI